MAEEMNIKERQIGIKEREEQPIGLSSTVEYYLQQAEESKNERREIKAGEPRQMIKEMATTYANEGVAAPEVIDDPQSGEKVALNWFAPQLEIETPKLEERGERQWRVVSNRVENSLKAAFLGKALLEASETLGEDRIYNALAGREQSRAELESYYERAVSSIGKDEQRMEAIMRGEDVREAEIKEREGKASPWRDIIGLPRKVWQIPAERIEELTGEQEEIKEEKAKRRKAMIAVASVSMAVGACNNQVNEVVKEIEKVIEPTPGTTSQAEEEVSVTPGVQEPTATPEITPQVELTAQPPVEERFVEFEPYGEVEQEAVESLEELPDKIEEKLLVAIEEIGLKEEGMSVQIIRREDEAGKVWYNIMVGRKASEESMYLERLWLYAEINEAQTQYMLPGEGVEGRLIPIGFTYQVEGEIVGPTLAEGQSPEAVLFGLGYGEEENFQWVREFMKLDLEENQIYYIDPWTGEQYQLKEEINRGILASIIPAEAQLFPGLPIEGAREALSRGWIMDLDEEGNWVIKNEKGKVKRVWNKEAQKWEKLLPFEVNLERGEYRAMSKQEVEIIRQGLKDKERAAELKDGNGFIMRLPETGQLIAVVCPKIMKIGDLEDPHPDLYPDYKEINVGTLEKMLMEMRPGVEGENWDDMVEDGRTANLIVVQASFIRGGESHIEGGTGFILNTRIDEQVLLNTAVHVVTYDESDFKRWGANMSLDRFEELMESGYPKANFTHLQTNVLVLNLGHAIIMGQYPVNSQVEMLRRVGESDVWFKLLYFEKYPFYVRIEGLNY